MFLRNVGKHSPDDTLWHVHATSYRGAFCTLLRIHCVACYAAVRSCTRSVYSVTAVSRVRPSVLMCVCLFVRHVIYTATLILLNSSVMYDLTSSPFRSILYLLTSEHFSTPCVSTEQSSATCVLTFIHLNIISYIKY